MANSVTIRTTAPGAKGVADDFDKITKSVSGVSPKLAGMLSSAKSTLIPNGASIA